MIDDVICYFEEKSPEITKMDDVIYHFCRRNHPRSEWQVTSSSIQDVRWRHSYTKSPNIRVESIFSLRSIPSNSQDQSVNSANEINDSVVWLVLERFARYTKHKALNYLRIVTDARTFITSCQHDITRSVMTIRRIRCKTILYQPILFQQFYRSFSISVFDGQRCFTKIHCMCFNRRLQVGHIPSSVADLSFGHEFDQTLEVGDIPSSVTHLTFGGFDQR